MKEGGEASFKEVMKEGSQTSENKGKSLTLAFFFFRGLLALSWTLNDPLLLVMF